MKRILLTGSTGFLGQLLKLRLRAEGHEVFTLNRRVDEPGGLAWPGDAAALTAVSTPVDRLTPSIGVGRSELAAHPAPDSACQEIGAATSGYDAPPARATSARRTR